MADLTPISREEMRVLKVETDEKNRVGQIKQFVTSFYKRAIEKASSSDEYSIQLELKYENYHYNERRIKFDTRDKTDIKNLLQTLFPDCAVGYKIIPVTDSHYSNMTYSKEFLVIDWS